MSHALSVYRCTRTTDRRTASIFWKILLEAYIGPYCSNVQSYATAVCRYILACTCWRIFLHPSVQLPLSWLGWNSYVELHTARAKRTNTQSTWMRLFRLSEFTHFSLLEISSHNFPLSTLHTSTFVHTYSSAFRFKCLGHSPVLLTIGDWLLQK